MNQRAPSESPASQRVTPLPYAAPMTHSLRALVGGHGDFVAFSDESMGLGEDVGRCVIWHND